MNSGLIAHHEVTDEANDPRQLQPVTEQVKTQADVETLSVVTDSGYSNGEQLAACEAIPANRAINNQGDYYQKNVRKIFDTTQQLNDRLHKSSIILV